MHDALATARKFVEKPEFTKSDEAIRSGDFLHETRIELVKLLL